MEIEKSQRHLMVILTLVSDLVFCIPANKVLLHSVLKTPGDFFGLLKSFGQTKKSEVDSQQKEPFSVYVVLDGAVDLECV